MYSGARTQFGDGASPFAIPNIGIDASQHAIQRGAVTLDETVKQYFKIQDFGEEQRLESDVRGLQSKFDVEFQRRASLAPGSSSQALYDSDGTLRESVLQDLSDEYAGKIGELRGGFVLPESRMKSDAMRQRVGDSFLNSAYQKAALLGIQRTRQAFDEGLKGDLLREDYAGASRRAREAAQAGVISQQKAENLEYGFHQDELIKQAQHLMRKDPSELAFQMDEGLWNGLNEKNLFKVQDELERMLRGNAEQLPYTASELKAIQEGRTVPPKYADLPGDTEKMRVWRQAKREGKLYLYKDDIDAEFRKEIANGPVFDSQTKYETWKKEMVKDCSDEKTGFGLTPDEVELACDHHIANMVSAGSGNSFNAAKLFDDLGYQQVVPLFYEKWRKKAETGYLTSNRRTVAEGAAVSEMEAAMERVKSNALKAYLSWERDHGNKSRDEKFMKASELLTMFANNEKTSFDNKTFETNIIKKEAIYASVYGNLDEYTNDSGKAVLDEQKKRHQEYREERAESAKKATQQRTVDQAKFMPVEVDNVINVSEREPGIYLDRKTFEQVVKAHGDAPVVLATIPERGSRRAAAKLPILGWHEGEGTMLTSGARVRLLGRIRNVNSLQLKFLKSSESKALEDSKMKEFTEKKKRKTLDADAPPDDFGLVPDNGIETAQPVSGTYLNGELTMLPPL